MHCNSRNIQVLLLAYSTTNLFWRTYYLNETRRWREKACRGGTSNRIFLITSATILLQYFQKMARSWFFERNKQARQTDDVKSNIQIKARCFGIFCSFINTLDSLQTFSMPSCGEIGLTYKLLCFVYFNSVHLISLLTWKKIMDAAIPTEM